MLKRSEITFALRPLQFAVKRGVVLFLVAFIVSGCSGFKVLYSLTGEAVRSEADFFLDLTEDEEVLLDQTVDQLLAWHRGEMMPRYAHFLGRHADRFESGTQDEANLKLAITDMRNLLRETVHGAAPFISDVLVHQTDPEKLQFLRARLVERAEDRSSELGETPEQQIEIRTERAVKRFKRFLGDDLSDRQIELIRQYYVASNGTFSRWQTARRERERALLSFLSERPDKRQIELYIPKILLRSEEVVGTEYRQLSDEWWFRFQVFMLEMAGTVTAKQRAQVVATMRKYAEEMIDISS